MKEKWKRMLYIGRVVLKGGPLSFLYLVFHTIRSIFPEGWKYRCWRKKNEKPLEKRVPSGSQPFLSIILMGDGSAQISRQSIAKQDYGNVECLEEEADISWGYILSKAKGDYIGILCRGDQLADDALQRLAWLIKKPYAEEKQLFYSDEDRMTENGHRYQPFFKPDYSPDTLRSFFYMGGFLVMKRELAERLTENRSLPLRYGGYLLALEASFLIEKDQVCHISQVWYHRQEHVPRTDVLQMGRDKERLFASYGMAVETELVKDCMESRVVYLLKNRPKISIIIPSKDHPELLKFCFDSIFTYSRYENYEIVVVDNGSHAKHREEYERLCSDQKGVCSYYYEPMEFNFSRMCNWGARKASGEYYLFLNDDIEVCQIEGRDWLERLLGQAMQKHTGAVGAKLLYPASNRIQHVGIVNYESGASHILGKLQDGEPLLVGRNRLDYNYSAVTGACLCINRDKFWQVNGFTEELAVTFNDMELGFKLCEAGYYNVVRTDVALYHHESISRGADSIDPTRFVKHLKERERLFELHPSFVKKDPFYSRHLTQRGLNGGINMEIRPDDFHLYSDSRKIGRIQEETMPMDAMIEYMETEGEQLCIRGFAYSEQIRYNNWNQIYVVLKGRNESWYVQTQKVYNHTIATQRESVRNLNFVEFYTVIPLNQLQEHQYQAGIVLKPFGTSYAYQHMLHNIWREA